MIALLTVLAVIFVAIVIYSDAGSGCLAAFGALLVVVLAGILADSFGGFGGLLLALGIALLLWLGFSHL